MEVWLIFASADITTTTADAAPVTSESESIGESTSGGLRLQAGGIGMITLAGVLCMLQ